MAKDLESLADEIHRAHVAGQQRNRHVKQSIHDSKIRANFWKKVNRAGDADCWPWEGFRKASGHGLTSYKSMPIHASRKAYILTYGYIESKDSVLHRCDNAACCNPSHLYLGSRADNMIDRWGKTLPGERSARGRHTTLDETQLERLWQMRRQGAKLKECATEFNVHIATICRYITMVRKQKLEKIRADRLDVRKIAGI